MFTVREASKGDLNKIGDLWVELIEFHHDLDIRFNVPKNGHEEYIKQCRHALKNKNYIVLVALNDLTDSIAGYIIGYIAESGPLFDYPYYGFIADICVTADYRGSGVGKALVNGALKWFVDKGVPNVQLNAACCNNLSQNFWRKIGFGDYLNHLYMRIK